MSADQETSRLPPGALPGAARRKESARGRLKIFLGAAPGVGKTYEMLTSAHERLAAGIDTAAGIVETHGRAETEALLSGLEVIPRRQVHYKGRVLDEMDLDALLARRPELALVDELAHTNAPGSRHPKRYLDVEELLAAGIGVYTTLNIQHVESLNDAVAQITGIRVRETVPDSILDKADDIEVIDLAPGELMQRLREGKVYVPREAERALKNYFSPGNLTALRELALRRTAQRVDEQLSMYMQEHAIDGQWPASDSERVLVCINEDPHCAALVRYTKRFADRLRAPWTALYIETVKSLGLPVVERDRIADTLRLAERLGGVAAALPGSGHVAGDVIDFAHLHNVTQIVIGKSISPRWLELLGGSVVQDLVRRSGKISVHVIAGDALKEEAIPGKSVRTAAPGANIAGYFAALWVTAGGTLAAQFLKPYFGGETVPLIFMMGVIGAACLSGLGPSILAAVASMLCYNFFFIPPIYSFTIADPVNAAALFFFLFTALIVSNLTSRVRRQADLARNRAAITAALYGFSSNLASQAQLDDLLATAASQIAESMGADVAVLLPDASGRLQVSSSVPPGGTIGKTDLGAAQWCFEHGRPAGQGSDTLPGTPRLFLPLRTSRGPIGVIGLAAGSRPDIILTPGERRLLDALMDQAAVAIERVRLAKEMDDARVAAETERLRGSLLTSLSHDLKTPLASILGAAGSLREYGDRFDAAARAEMIGTIEEEAGRMARFVANLLDMTRLESGAIELRRQPADVLDVIGAALQRTEGLLKDFKIALDIEGGLPLLELDEILLDQVLFNLLDNAAKYSPPSSTITITARRSAHAVKLQVLDEGPGIPEEQLSLIFEKFHRAKSRDHQRAGTGLGLAICRGFAEAMGGTVTAANRNDRSGAIFTVELPVPASLARGRPAVLA